MECETFHDSGAFEAAKQQRLPATAALANGIEESELHGFVEARGSW